WRDQEQADGYLLVNRIDSACGTDPNPLNQDRRMFPSRGPSTPQQAEGRFYHGEPGLTTGGYFAPKWVADVVDYSANPPIGGCWTGNHIHQGADTNTTVGPAQSTPVFYGSNYPWYETV